MTTTPDDAEVLATLTVEQLAADAETLAWEASVVHRTGGNPEDLRAVLRRAAALARAVANGERWMREDANELRSFDVSDGAVVTWDTDDYGSFCGNAGHPTLAAALGAVTPETNDA